MFQSALELDPTFGDLYTDIGAVYLRQRRYPEAIEAFEQAIAYTHNPSARAKLGHALGVCGPHGRGPRDPEKSRTGCADRLHPRVVDLEKIGLGDAAEADLAPGPGRS